MKEIDVIIGAETAAMSRLIETLNVRAAPEGVVGVLNRDYSHGFFDYKRMEVYLRPLGYFEMGKTREKDRYFVIRFDRDLPPDYPRRSVNINWSLYS